MKILIVSTSDMDGGAARAAYRLHHSLLAQNIDSQMLVQSKRSDEYRIIGPRTKVRKVISKFRPFLDGVLSKLYKSRTKTLFSSAWLPFGNTVNKINEINPDIVHLHWIAGGMLRIEDLQRIKAPIVWSLHDMWAFTGGCHYDEECNAYQDHCGNCKVLGSQRDYDLSRINLKRKLRTYSKIKNLTINGSSKWITEAAKSSLLLKERNVVNIPNPIDGDVFKPLDKSLVRSLLKIPLDKRIVLFGAVNPLGDPRKGFEPLFNALNLLEIDDVEFVIAGSSEPKSPEAFKYPVHYISPLLDEMSLPVLYNIADVVVVPSLQENLANSVVESLLCGIPVVAFDIGGNPDMIDHKKNGYLVKPFDSKDMALGIEWIINNKNYAALSSSAREKSVANYSYDIVSNRYIELYKKITVSTSGGLS